MTGQGAGSGQATEGDRREEILDAALGEFSEKGFRGATIKSIATRAGIGSPALLYWYFKDKEDLFQGVLGRHAPILQALRHSDELLERPPEEVLPQLARAYLATVNSPIPQRLARLVVGEALRRPELADAIVKRGPLQVLRFLQNYMTRQVELGRFRRHDVRSSARAFIGMLIPQAAANVVLPALKADGLSDDEHLRTSIEIFLRGLRRDGTFVDSAEGEEGRSRDEDPT